MIYLLFALGFSLALFFFLGQWQSRGDDFFPLNLNQIKSEVIDQNHQKELDKQLSLLLSRGWSVQTLAQVYLTELRTEAVTADRLQASFLEVSRLGSPLFCQMWQVEKNQSTARRRLEIALSLVDLPLDWSGQEDYLARQLERIYPLAPDDDFWKDLAETVSQSFPNRQLSQKSDNLARQVHQLRYVLSLQQSLWVRANYGGKGRSDRQALQAYLSQSGATYTSRESARLHNKVKKGEETVLSHLKVLVNFHSEFILDREGNFLNILDGSEQGLVNGASFNYASRTNRRHWELDVWPVAKHDPLNRRRLLKSYRSPRTGASTTHSKHLKQISRQFEGEIKRSKTL